MSNFNEKGWKNQKLGFSIVNFRIFYSNLILNLTAKFKFQWKIFTISSLNLSFMMSYHWYSVRAHPIDEQNVKIHQYIDSMRKLQIWVFYKNFPSKAIFFSKCDFRGCERTF